MTTYTRNLLAKEALAVLFRDGGSGHAPDADDIEYVDARIEAVVAELETRNIVSVPDLEDIEAAHFLPLATILAMAVANHFSKPVDKAQREDAIDRLEIMTQNSPPSRTTLDVDPALKRGGVYGLAQWTRGD